MKVVHFGAGNIGRGFIGKLLADAGCTVVFADVNPKVIELLQKNQQYTVQVVGEASRTERVSNVTGVRSDSPDLQTHLADCQLITTAVGPVVLEKIAPALAQALRARQAAGTLSPLNIIACENMVRGTSQLKQHVLTLLPPELHSEIEQLVGFADSAVDRIVPPSPPNPEDPLAVTVETFSEWIVDKTQLKHWSANIPGMELTDQLMAFVERKLFTLNTGHAITAYLGKLKGYATVREAIADPAIRADVTAAMQESGEVLIRRYGFNPAAHAAYIQKILTRFDNPYLHDDVTRVGREPLRKISKGDRLIRPLLGTLEYGTGHTALVKGLAAALRYTNPEDPQAVSLQKTLETQGVKGALALYADHALPDPIVDEVEAAYQKL